MVPKAGGGTLSYNHEDISRIFSYGRYGSKNLNPIRFKKRKRKLQNGQY